MGNDTASVNKLKLTDQCVFKSLLYLSEAIQYYWPATMYDKNAINIIAENNIALHLARAFSENGFLVWAEIPFKGSPEKKFDFLAYNYSLDILVALELKNNIETPKNNLIDLHRLVQIQAEGICSVEHPFNNQCFGVDKKPDFYGIVTILNAVEFANWWRYPNTFGNYQPHKRFSDEYKNIGKALEVSKCKGVIPLCERVYSGSELQDRFCRAAYALYDEDNIGGLAEVLKKTSLEEHIL